MADKNKNSTAHNPKGESHFRPDRQPLAAHGAIDCHVEDFTATISADVTLASAQDVLSEFNQWIPIDGDPRTPVGKLVEQNSTGPLRLGYGAWRDLLLGCQFRIGTGELITAGGRTVKNVAGYDLTKFLVGQRGVFGEIVTITTRTYRRPSYALLAEFAPSDQFITQIISTPLRPRWALLTPTALRCGWLDDELTIDLAEKLASQLNPLLIQRRSVQDDVTDRAACWKTGGDYLRAAVPPAKILSFAELAKLTDWIADAAFGIVLIPLNNHDPAIVQRAADTIGGSVTSVIDGKMEWQPTAAETAILASLKKAFDPDSRLPMLS